MHNYPINTHKSQNQRQHTEGSFVHSYESAATMNCAAAASCCETCDGCDSASLRRLTRDTGDSPSPTSPSFDCVCEEAEDRGARPLPSRVSPRESCPCTFRWSIDRSQASSSSALLCEKDCLSDAELCRYLVVHAASAHGVATAPLAVLRAAIVAELDETTRLAERLLAFVADEDRLDTEAVW